MEKTVNFVKGKKTVLLKKIEKLESENGNGSQAAGKQKNKNEIWVNLINTIQDNSFTLKEYKRNGWHFLREKKKKILSDIEITINDIKELELQSNGLSNSPVFNNNKMATAKLSQSFSQNICPTVATLDMFDMSSCVKVLHSLRMNPLILTDCLMNNGRLGRGQTVEHTELADFITRAIFNGCLTELEERIHLELVETVLHREFNNDPKTFDPANEYFSLNLLSAYISNTFGKFFINAVKGPIISIAQYPLFTLETDDETHEILKLSTAEAINSDIKQQRIQIINDEIANFLLEIFNKSYLIPFALKWFTKKCLELINQTRPCKTHDESQARLRAVIVHIIFSSYIIPELVKPNNVYMITGQIVTQNIKHNLRLLSEKIRIYMETPEVIPDQLEQKHKIREKIDIFCNGIVSVNDLKSYFKETYEPKNSISDLKMMLSNYDLKKIVEIIRWDTSLDFRRMSLQNSAKRISEIPTLNNNTQTGMVLFWINTTPNPLAQPKLSRHRIPVTRPNSFSKRDSKTITEVENRNIVTLEKGLRAIFIHFERAQCGFSSDSLRDLILSRQARLTPTDNTTHNQFEEILKSLALMPDYIAENNYERLALDILKEEEESTMSEKEESMKLIRSIDQLEQYRKRLLNKKHNLFCSIFFFNTSITSEIDEYIQFIKSTVESYKYCQCKDAYLMSHCDEQDRCDHCLSLQATVQKLFEKISKSMAEFQEQLMNSPDHIVPSGMFIYSTYKRKLMINLHSSLFFFSKLNINFQVSLNSRINIPNFLENFIKAEIAEKYLDQSRWVRSINELKKINHLKSPDDMLSCIKETSSTLIKVYALPHGGYEPDQLISIMAYIILAAKVDNIIAHVQYIKLYAEIDEDENDLPRFIDSIVYLMNRLCSNSVKSSSKISQQFLASQHRNSVSEKSLSSSSINLSSRSIKIGERMSIA